jgi:hypothetical protein
MQCRQADRLDQEMLGDPRRTAPEPVEIRTIRLFADHPVGV